MSKYIDKDRVLEYIIFGVVGKEITCGELKRAIESLPTIEVSEDCIGDCNICRFAGCSECDDCINGSQWVRMTREDEE